MPMSLTASGFEHLVESEKGKYILDMGPRFTKCAILLVEPKRDTFSWFFGNRTEYTKFEEIIKTKDISKILTKITVVYTYNFGFTWTTSIDINSIKIGDYSGLYQCWLNLMIDGSAIVPFLNARLIIESDAGLDFKADVTRKIF